MKTVILHVGMHKTGTTSLQNSLQGLAANGVRYVDLGPSNHGIPIRATFAARTDPEMLRILKVRGTGELESLRQRTLRNLDRELSLPGFDRFIISGESISLLGPPSVAALREVLLRYVDRIDVSAYVRDPVGFSASAFQEHVKDGHAKYQVPQPKYRAKLEKFITLFGRDHFRARLFDPGSLREGSVVADFCHQWGVPFDVRKEARKNESLSEPAVKLLHLFNRIEPALHQRSLARWARPRMVQDIASHFPGTFRLPAKFHARAFDVDDARWLRDQCGIEFAPPPDTGAKGQRADFRAYLEDIDPAVIDSYRDLVASLGMAVRTGDSAADLLKRHYRRCERSPQIWWKVLTRRVAS